MLILLLSVLHLLDEALRWLEAWQVVSWDSESGVLRDVASGLSCTVLDVEAAEATQVYIVLLFDEALLNLFHKSLYYSTYFFLRHTSSDSYLINDICFGHFFIFY